MPPASAGHQPMKWAAPAARSGAAQAPPQAPARAETAAMVRRRRSGRYRAWAQSWSSAGVELTRSFPVQACKHPPAASLFSPAFRALGSKPGTKVTARSSLIMGWFSCAAALLGSPNAQGKPPQHIHLPLGGRRAPGKAEGKLGIALE